MRPQRKKSAFQPVPAAKADSRGASLALPKISRIPAYALLALAYLLGCVSLGLFGLFLWRGPAPVGNLNATLPWTLGLDALLALLFFLQHSGMLRKSFRTRLALLIPEDFHPVVYAIVSGAVLLLVPLLWQPTRVELLTLQGPLRWLMRGAFLAAMAGMVWGIASLRHFDPLGTGPLLARLRGRREPDAPLVIKGTYRWMRHPLYAFFVLMVWATPEITADRLLFNVLWSGWMLVGTRLEERDLAAHFGEAYREYQRKVPMFLPRIPRPRT